MMPSLEMRGIFMSGEGIPSNLDTDSDIECTQLRDFLPFSKGGGVICGDLL